MKKSGKTRKILSFILMAAMLLSIAPFAGIGLTAKAAGHLIWPVPGHYERSQPFHAGNAIDISDGSIAGARVVAAMGGTVTTIYYCTRNHYGDDSGNCCYGFGTGLVITGDDGRIYQYCHMQAGSIPGNVYYGAYVSAGQQIGRVGMTGNASGNHLHFGISFGKYWYAGVDPDKENYDHSYSPTITKQPTCTSSGVKTYRCSCGASYTETIGALGHDYKNYSEVVGTCVENGKKVLKCSRCSDEYITAYTGKNPNYHKNRKELKRYGKYMEICDCKCNDCGKEYTVDIGIESAQVTKTGDREFDVVVKLKSDSEYIPKVDEYYGFNVRPFSFISDIYPLGFMVVDRGMEISDYKYNNSTLLFHAKIPEKTDYEIESGHDAYLGDYHAMRICFNNKNNSSLPTRCAFIKFYMPSGDYYHLKVGESLNLKDAIKKTSGYSLRKYDTNIIDFDQETMTVTAKNPGTVTLVWRNNKNGHYKGCTIVVENPAASCTHLCHNGGFIWAIVRFFCKLFRTNKYCSCGAAHY